MADEKPYNISIETKAQISELQKLLAELQSINAEIGKMNGLTLSSINTSVSELVKTGKELSNTFVSLSKPADKLANGLKKIGEKSGESGDKLDGLKTTAQGVFMEIGAQITDFAVNKLKQIPAAIIGSIQAFGQQDAAVQKLAAAIRSQGGNVSEVLPIMSSFASEMQRITTYGDEQVLAMQSMATAMAAPMGKFLTDGERDTKCHMARFGFEYGRGDSSQVFGGISFFLQNQFSDAAAGDGLPAKKNARLANGRALKKCFACGLYFHVFRIIDVRPAESE